MAEDDHSLVEGAYVVISGTGHALDIPGARDASSPHNRYHGEQAEVYTLNHSSAQIVRLISTSSGWVLYWPLCGLVLSAGQLDKDGKPYQGSKVVFQGNTGQDQAHFNIEYRTTDSGYDWYRITSTLNTSMAVIHENKGNESKVIMGDPIAGTSNMIWRFEPVTELMDGTYSLLLKRNTAYSLQNSNNNVSVLSASQTAMTNGDVWAIGSDDAGRKVLTSLANGHEIWLGSVVNSGVRVYLFPSVQDNTINLWLPEQLGTKEVNGVTYDAFYFRAMAGQNLVLDPYNLKPTPQQYVVASEVENVEAAKNKDDYAFVPVPAEAELDLTVPGAIRHVVGGAESVNAVASGLVTAYPSWASDGEHFQVRYQYRTRTSSLANGAFSSWSKWMSVADSSTYADGWGAVGEPNVDASLGDGRWVANRGATFTLSPTGIDLVEINWQVRRFEYEWPWRDAYVTAHGAAASGKCKIAMAPSLTVDGVSFSVDGAEVSYHGDWGRSGSTVRLWSEGCFDTGAMTGVTMSKVQGGSKALASKVTHIPDDGEQLVVQWSVTTCDGVTSTGSAQVAVSCDITGALAMGATITDEDGLVKRVVLEHQGSQRLWIVVDGESMEITPEEDGSFLVPYPMLDEWSIRAVAIDPQGRVRSFGSEMEPCGEETAMWNWTGGWCRLDHAMGNAPSESFSVSKDTSSAAVTGREWRFVQVSDQRSGSFSVSGSLVYEMGEEDGPFDALSDCRFAWFRDPWGHVARVAVTSVNMTYKDYGVDVSVKMERVDG